MSRGNVVQTVRWFAMNARQGDLVVGFVVLGLVAYIFAATAEMPTGPAGFPRLIAIGLLICGLILFVRAYLNKRDSAPLFTDISWPTICFVGGLWLLLIILAVHIGFLLPGAAFLGIVAWQLTGRPRSLPKLARILAFAIGVSIGLWLIFHKLLGVESPGGFLF